MKSLIIFALVFASTGILRSQGFGYMGKKNVFSIQTNTSFRFFSCVTQAPIGETTEVGYSHHVYNGNLLERKKKYFRWDARIGYSRLLSRRFGLGVEFTYANMRLGLNSNQYALEVNSEDNWSNFFLYPSSPSFNVYGGYLVLDLYSLRAQAPLGFHFSFGIGPKIYAFDMNENYRLTAEAPDFIPFPEYKKNMVGVHGFVGLNTRKLVASFMAIDLGLRVNLGGVFRNGVALKSAGISDEKSIYTAYENHTPYNENEIPSTYLYSKTDVQKWVNGEVMGNLFSLRLGLTFML
jgi:hypothetical protein